MLEINCLLSSTYEGLCPYSSDFFAFNDFNPTFGIVLVYLISSEHNSFWENIYGKEISFDKERYLWKDIYGKIISFDKERYWLKSSLKSALYLFIRSFNHFLSTTLFSFLYEWILSRNSSTSFFEGDGLDGSGVLMPGVVITGFWASLVLLMFVSVIFFFRIKKPPFETLYNLALALPFLA